MNEFFSRVSAMLGYRQRAYQETFAGSPRQHVLVDLAKFARAFDADLDGLSHDQLMTMHGRRQMFFRIVHHLKLSPTELEQVYQPALMQAAARLRTNQGADE